MNLFYLAGGFGVILALVGLWRVVANHRFLARTTTADGKLVNWEITEAGKVGGPSSSNGGGARIDRSSRSGRPTDPSAG